MNHHLLLLIYVDLKKIKLIHFPSAVFIIFTPNLNRNKNLKINNNNKTNTLIGTQYHRAFFLLLWVNYVFGTNLHG